MESGFSKLTSEVFSVESVYEFNHTDKKTFDSVGRCDVVSSLAPPIEAWDSDKTAPMAAQKWMKVKRRAERLNECILAKVQQHLHGRDFGATDGIDIELVNAYYFAGKMLMIHALGGKIIQVVLGGDAFLTEGTRARYYSCFELPIILAAIASETIVDLYGWEADHPDKDKVIKLAAHQLNVSESQASCLVYEAIVNMRVMLLKKEWRKCLERLVVAFFEEEHITGADIHRLASKYKLVPRW